MKTSVMVKGIISNNLISQTHSKDCTIECTKYEGNCNELYSSRMSRKVERDVWSMEKLGGQAGIHPMMRAMKVATLLSSVNILLHTFHMYGVASKNMRRARLLRCFLQLVLANGWTSYNFFKFIKMFILPPKASCWQRVKSGKFQKTYDVFVGNGRWDLQG